MTKETGAAGAPARPWPQSVAEFERLIDALQDKLVQFAFRRLQSKEDAEDVVQDVLVQAFREREKYRAVDHADPFLFRMVANRATDVLRRRKRIAASNVPVAAAGSPDPGLVDRLRAVEATLARLPRRQAEVIRLRVWAELSFEEVAAAVGCSVPTVKSRFHYGIEKIRRFLKRQGGNR